MTAGNVGSVVCQLSLSSSLLFYFWGFYVFRLFFFLLFGVYVPKFADKFYLRGGLMWHPQARLESSDVKDMEINERDESRNCVVN